MKPAVLIAETSCFEYVRVIQEMGWGRMFCQRKIHLFPGEGWGFDNGAFLDWHRGQEFDGDRFLRRLDSSMGLCAPMIAVTPDIVGKPESLEFSVSWLDRLPGSWPWYLAVQDGMKVHDVAQALPMFAGLFLGGTDRFKLTAHRWADLAKAQDKKFHYARAGTPTKLRHATRVGADSLDTAFPLWTRERFNLFVRLWQHESEQEEFRFV